MDIRLSATCFCERLLLSILLAQKSQNNNQVNFWLVSLNECVLYKQHDITHLLHMYNQQETILLFRQEYIQLQIIYNVRRAGKIQPLLYHHQEQRL